MVLSWEPVILLAWGLKTACHLLQQSSETLGSEFSHRNVTRARCFRADSLSEPVRLLNSLCAFHKGRSPYKAPRDCLASEYEELAYSIAIYFGIRNICVQSHPSKGTFVMVTHLAQVRNKYSHYTLTPKTSYDQV